MDYRQKSLELKQQSGYTRELPTGWQGSLFAQAELDNYLTDSEGCFALLYRDPSSPTGRKRQQCFRVSLMPTVLSCINPNTDNWISQATFWSPWRRVCNVKNISMIFADMDIYKDDIEFAGWARGRSFDQLADCINFFCDNEGIPHPSIIIFSGRGLQCKWFFEKPLIRNALPRWNLVEKELLKRLKPYGADQSAKDAARVLRLVETVNTKNGKKCQVIHVEEVDGAPVVYDFEFLAECLLPMLREDAREEKKARQLKVVNPERGLGGNPNVDFKTLNWLILEDLRKVISLRGGVIAEGSRDLFTFWLMNYMALSGQISSDSFYREALFVAHEVNPAFKYHDSAFGTLYQKFLQSLKGEKVEFRGRLYSPLYTPKMATLIDLLEISEDEQQQLKVIHSASIRKEIRAEAQIKNRRGNGVLPREEYEARGSARAERARALKEAGKSTREIAEELGLSRKQIIRYLG